MGGDHGSVYGAIAAHAHAYPGMGILHLDAHADLRDAYEGFTWSHASIFHNVLHRLPEVSALVQVGLRDVSEDEHRLVEASGGRVILHTDPELKRRGFDGEPWARQVDRIVSDLPEQVYLSFDIDGLDPTLCPHTGTPVPGGLSFPEATALHRRASCARGAASWGWTSTRSPPVPTGDEWDGNVGARLLYKMIGWALRSQRGGEGR